MAPSNPSIKQLSIGYWILVIFIVALLLRLALIPHPGFEADISFWKAWGLAVYDKGLVEGIRVSNNNYPVPFSYVLGTMTWVYSWFANPHNFNEYWTNTNVIFLFVSKLPAILADFGIAGIIVWIGKNGKKLSFPAVSPSWLLLLVAFYLLNPISLIDGAWWGQVDSLGVFMFLLAFVAVLKRWPLLAGFLYMASMMTKLQNMIYGPLFFLFTWQLLGFPALVRAVAGAVLGFLGLNIEFFLARDMGRVVGSLVDNFDYFPLMSLNAYNIWWIFSGAHGMQMSDKMLTIGLVNAKTLGLLLFSSTYLFAVLRQLMEKRNPTRIFLEGLIVINAGFFLFQTQSHDRYAFPLSVFLLLWAPFFFSSPSNQVAKLRSSIFMLFYSLFTLVYFYNLHTALVANYPHNGLPILSSLTSAPFTITASIILIGLFVVFLFHLARRNILLFLVPCCLSLITIIAMNLPLLRKTPVPITKLTPLSSQQDYGSRQTNMPVGAGSGFTKWSPLSVQYAFYRLGLGTHANSNHTYNLNSLFTRFTSDYGLDTEAGPQGSATFEVWGDGKRLFTSDTIKRFEYPRHLDIDIHGVKMLSIVTTGAGDGITDDHTDWLNPQLWP